MFICKVDSDLFLRLCTQIGPGVVHFLRQHLAAPQSKGKLCELTVGFKYAAAVRPRPPGGMARITRSSSGGEGSLKWNRWQQG